MMTWRDRPAARLDAARLVDQRHAVAGLGEVVRLRGPGVIGRNVLLSSGVAEDVEVDLVSSFGDARILAEDVGYDPVSATRSPPPQCANGVDDETKLTSQGDSRVLDV